MIIQVSIRLKEVRMLEGITIRQLAKLSGISRSEISGIETGGIMPTVYILCCLAVVLHKKLEDLVEIRY